MSGLSFLAPMYLLGALAIAVPLLLHLYRRRTEDIVDFPSIAWLEAVPVETQQRRRLRDWLLLALRVAALLLLAGAFARPYLTTGELATSRSLTVVAIDVSASMAAPGVWTRAQQAALEALDAVAGGDLVALVRFDERAGVEVAPTADREAVREALLAMQPGDSTTALHAAVRQANELIGARDGRLVLVSDLQQSGWDRALAGVVSEELPIEIRAVEGARGNLAITDVSLVTGASASTVGDATPAVAVTLRNFGVAQQQTTVTVQPGALAPAVSQQVMVAPQSAVSVQVPVAVRPADAVVTITDAEGIPSDNRLAWSSLRTDAAQVTVLVSNPGGSDGLYVQRALEALSARRRLQVSVVDGQSFSASAPAGDTQSPLVIVVGTRTLTRTGRSRLREHIDAGNPVLVTLGPSVDRETLREWLGRPLTLHPDDGQWPALGLPLVIDDVRHPVFLGAQRPDARLGEIPVRRSARVTATDGWRVMARVSDGVPLLLESEAAGNRLLLWTSDVDQQWNRFPLSPAFVPFMADAVSYLLGQPSGAREARAVVNEGNPWPLSPDALLADIPRGPRPSAPPPEVSARRLESEQQWWQAGLALMLTALLAEGWIGRRAR
jgi:hypothetical protein